MERAAGHASALALWIVLLGAMAGLACIALDRGDEPPDRKIEDVQGEASSERPASMKAEAPPAPLPQPDPPESKPPAAKPRRALSALATQMREDPTAFKKLVEAARLYFDLDEEQWRGRQALLAELETHAAAGRHILKDMDALRWLVYQGRSFEPQLTDRKWQRSFGVTENKKLGGTLHWLKSEDLTLTYSVPASYPKRDKDLRSKMPRQDPRPLLLAMHEKQDWDDAKYPGLALLKRHYPRKAWSELYKTWIVLCPNAEGGNFFENPTSAPAQKLRGTMAAFWRHYHVDFEHIVLTGSEQAFTVATSMPVFFAGIVLHGSFTLDEAQRELVPNMAPVPLFVVENPALAQQLREAGHENVTEGKRDAALLAWMNERHRVHPSRVSWTVQPKRYDQVLPYWVNLDSPNWDAAKRHVTIKVIDTEAEPNSILIEALGINALSLFLHDGVVDLDRPVRVVINGHVEHDERLKPGDRFAKLGRDFDFLFNREPVRIRESMFFGWLTPARIVSLTVRPPRHLPEPPPAPPPAPGPEPRLIPNEIHIPPSEVVADPPRDPPEKAPSFPWLVVLLALAAFAAMVLLLQQRRGN